MILAVQLNRALVSVLLESTALYFKSIPMNRYSFIIIQILGVIIAAIVMVELSFSERSLNILAIYLSVIAFVLSIFSPLRGYLVLIFFGCYLEVLKFGAWWQNARYIDMVSLNLPPIAAVAGICCGCLLLMVTGKVEITKTSIYSWVGAIFVGCLLGAKTLLGGGGEGSAIGDAANASAYLMLIPTTVTLFRTKEQCFGLISKAVWIAVRLLKQLKAKPSMNR